MQIKVINTNGVCELQLFLYVLLILFDKILSGIWIKITNLNHLPLGRLDLFVCVMNFQLSPVPPEHHVMKQDLLCLSLYLPVLLELLVSAAADRLFAAPVWINALSAATFRCVVCLLLCIY